MQIRNEYLKKDKNFVSSILKSVLYNLSYLTVFLSKSRKVHKNTSKHLPLDAKTPTNEFFDQQAACQAPIRWSKLQII